MSRSGYSDDCDNDWELICWRGAVASAIRGRRGQAFLRELLAALDARLHGRLIAHELEAAGEVCAIGSVGVLRGADLVVEMRRLNPDDPEAIAAAFGVAPALVKEIEFMNDEAGRHDETPERRFERMRAWIMSQIRTEGLSCKLPRIYVFCNNCSHEWHVMLALAEDGTALANHICSAHGFANHDMGIDENGWKRDLYATHYPRGYVVEWVEKPREHAGVSAAYAKNQAKREQS